MTKVPYSSELIQSKPRKLLFVYNSFLLVCLAMHSLNYKFNYTVGAVELVARTSAMHTAGSFLKEGKPGKKS